ncbi:MAG: hypothetical protein ABH868_02265 [bacterium]
MVKIPRNRDTGFGLLGIIIYVAVIAVVYMLILKLYVKTPANDEKEGKTKNSNPVDIINRANKNADALNQKRLEEEKIIQSIKETEKK